MALSSILIKFVTKRSANRFERATLGPYRNPETKTTFNNKEK